MDEEEVKSIHKKIVTSDPEYKARFMALNRKLNARRDRYQRERAIREAKVYADPGMREARTRREAMEKYERMRTGGKVSTGHNGNHDGNKCKHKHNLGKFDYHMGNPFEIKGNVFSKYG